MSDSFGLKVGVDDPDDIKKRIVDRIINNIYHLNI